MKNATGPASLSRGAMRTRNIAAPRDMGTAMKSAMMELMAHRLAGMQRAFMNIVSKPVSARLADTLISRQEDGFINLGLTHQELAQTIGTSRETVTALLSRFVTLGAITPVPDGYRITDEDLLDDIANGDVPVSPRHPVTPHASTMAG